MKIANTNDNAPNRPLTPLLWAYALLVLLLVSVSARLWWQSPMRLIQHEFDYFLGLFASPDPELSAAWIAIGRRLHLFGFVLVGGLYLVLARRLLVSPTALSTRAIAVWAAVVSAFFAIGMPWVSPDVFFYVGTGWVESHYHLSPYLASVQDVAGFAQDQMFANIYPGFLGGITSYGPLFQKIAAVVAGLSGGNEKLALALYKVLGLALHAGCSALVWRMAPTRFKPVALFSYAANPLVCFSVLTCAHNDHWMNLFVLLALLAVARRHWGLSGMALGAAFGIKYFPLVFVPVFGLAALVERREEGGIARNVINAARFAGAFLGTVALGYLVYPEALRAFANIATSGIAVYRNCIYYFIDVLTVYLLPYMFGLPGFVATHLNVGVPLRYVYVVLYALIVLALVPRLRRNLVRGIAETSLAVALLYFILVNTCNQEWYLTWVIGLALVLPYRHARTFALALSAGFLPLVIMTVNNPAPLWFIANVALYCLVLVTGGMYLVSLLRALPLREWTFRRTTGA